MTAVLGIDPGFRATGMALVDYETSDLLSAWTITPSVHDGHGIGPTLHQIAEHVTQAIREFEPFEVAIESPISHRSGSTTVRLGQVSGAILAGLWRHNIDPCMVNNQTRQSAAEMWLRGADVAADHLADMVDNTAAAYRVTQAKARACVAARLRWGSIHLTPDEADACWIAAVALTQAHRRFDGDVA